MSAWRIPMANPPRKIFRPEEFAALLRGGVSRGALAQCLVIEGRVTPPPRIKVVTRRDRRLRGDS